jgi:hypothetical protein
MLNCNMTWHLYHRPNSAPVGNIHDIHRNSMHYDMLLNPLSSFCVRIKFGLKNPTRLLRNSSWICFEAKRSSLTKEIIAWGSMISIHW